jgi:hypothetical protein
MTQPHLGITRGYPLHKMRGGLEQNHPDFWSRTILIFGQLYGLLYLYYIVFILHQEIILMI